MTCVSCRLHLSTHFKMLFRHRCHLLSWAVQKCHQSCHHLGTPPLPTFQLLSKLPSSLQPRCLLMWKAYVCQDSGRRAKETSHLERTEFSSCVFEKRSAEPASSLQAAGVKLLSIKQGVYRCLRKHFCVDQQARISQTICRMSMRED